MGIGQRWRSGRHARKLAIAAVAVAMAVTVAPAVAQAAPPPQEPGITLRVYDMQTALSQLCTLKAGQTPNVDKKMNTINWSTATDFGFEDFFIAHVLGYVNIATAGSYTFRLTSDDGSRLLIDDSLVINNDGLHGPTPLEGTITLTTGYHALRIEHFEQSGGQQLTLDWRTPGSSSFVLVPNSVLSTDAGVVRVTAPGRKECEGAGDSPGDGLPLTSVHPNFTLRNLRPSGFNPKVTGMDWLADGRMVISTWGGSDQSGTSQAGEVYILSNTGGGSGTVTTKRIGSNLKEPQGLKVVDGVVYVSEKARLTRLVDTNGDEVADQYQTVATWPYGGNFHEFAFGLLYQAPNFYVNLSVSINSGGATTNPQPAPNRGTTIRVNKDTGAVTYVAGGLRTPHGIGWGPEGDIFVTDNQGGWLPSSKLLHVKQNRFFNHYMNPAGPYDSSPVTQPVLWMPQNEIANSPSTPMYMTSGLYSGQFLIGDVTYGGLQRGYLEKINGEYQGALFRLTQGLEAGVSEVNVGPDGAIYVGGLGAGGNWGQTGKLLHGLQKLTPNGGNHFDMLAMRALPNGFEIEYTQPLSTATATALATKYRVKQWRYVATSAYGGPKIDEQTLSVSSASLSADGKKVTLVINGLQPGRVVHIRSPKPFASSNGQSLWSTEVWYTLNSIPGQQQANNLALGKPATADSSCATTEGPAKAVNGSVTGGNIDKWCSQGASKWMQVDLGTTQNVNQFVVKHAGAGGENTAWNTRDFNIQVSTNGTSWTTVSTTTANTASTTTHNIAATQARYVRLNITTPSSDGNTAARIYEFEVYGGGTPPVTGNLALNKPATADSSCATTESPAKAVNGTTTGGGIDKWCSSGATKWLQVDLGSSQTVSQFIIKHAGVGGESTAWNTRDFNIQVSTNGTSWTTVSTTTANTASMTSHNITATQARYVRLNVTTPASDGNTAARIYEFEIYANTGNVGRITLFDGTSMNNFVGSGGAAVTWPLGNGGVEVLGGDIRSKLAFGDFKAHVEFWLPNLPSNVTGQARANSGIYLQDRYELQVLDSWGDTTLANDECGAIYQKLTPSQNAARAPETWQTYDITFRAARYSGSTKTENARVTVVWNGVTIHNNAQIDGPTGNGAAEGAAGGPFRLQDHGDPGANLFYRNIWVEPVL